MIGTSSATASSLSDTVVPGIPDLPGDAPEKGLASVETELAALGVCFSDPACALKVAALSSACFTTPGTKALHAAIVSMAQSTQIDPISIADRMRQAGVSDPESLIVQAMGTGFLPSMCDEYTAILDRYRARRMLVQLGWRLWQDGRKDDCSVDALIADATKALESGVRSAGVETQSTHDALMDFVAWLDERNSDMLPTGIPDLDRVIGGFQPGQLIVLGARPKVGKSALATYIAQQVAKKGKTVLFVSLEMGAREIMQRRVAMESGVDLARINRKTLDADDYVRMAAAYADINTQPITYDTGAYTPYRIAASARELLPKGLALIVVDYLQLMSSDRKSDNRANEVATITRGLKRLAMDLKVPVLALSQFNRDSDRNGTRRMPTMSELRESGSIEQDANVVLILHAPDEVPSASKPELRDHYNACVNAGMGYMWLQVAANRQGPTGLIDLCFDRSHVRFTCFAHERGA